MVIVRVLVVNAFGPLREVQIRSSRDICEFGFRFLMRSSERDAGWAFLGSVRENTGSRHVAGGDTANLVTHSRRQDGRLCSAAVPGQQSGIAVVELHVGEQIPKIGGGFGGICRDLGTDDVPTRSCHRPDDLLEDGAWLLFSVKNIDDCPTCEAITRGDQDGFNSLGFQRGLGGAIRQRHPGGGESDGGDKKQDGNPSSQRWSELGMTRRFRCPPEQHKGCEQDPCRSGEQERGVFPRERDGGEPACDEKRHDCCPGSREGGPAAGPANPSANADDRQQARSGQDQRNDAALRAEGKEIVDGGGVGGFMSRKLVVALENFAEISCADTVPRMFTHHLERSFPKQ